MVQILPYVQSPLEQLAPHINQAVGSVAQGIGQWRKNKSDAAIDEQIANAKTDMEAFNAFSKYSPEKQKNLSPVFEQLIKQFGKAKEISPEQSKANAEKTERKERAGRLLSGVNTQKGLIPYVGQTDIPFTKNFGGQFNRTSVRQRERFDVLGAEAASFFRDLDTKGQLPQGLYEEVIKPRLTSSKLSEAENEGRMLGLIDLAKQYGGLSDEEAAEILTNFAPKNASEKSSERTPITKFFQ